MRDPLDPMDARLREAGVRWRAGQPEGADLALTSSSGRSRNAWLVPGVAAASVAALVGVGVWISGPDIPAAPTGDGPDRVPWADLAPTRPSIPLHRTPPTPDPALAAAASPCRAGDLTAASRVEGAAGTVYLNVTLSHRGAGTCQVAGIPDVTLYDAGVALDVPVEERTDDMLYRDPVLVGDGASASLALSWGSSWCTEAVRNDHVEIEMPGGGRLPAEGFLSSPGCYAEPGSGPTPVRAASFQPEQMRPGRRVSAFGEVSAAGDLDLLGTPASPVSFEVSLTSPVDVPLDVCPDYEIDQYAAGVSVERSYALNCAQVPYRLPDGTPYLPADTAVTFGMRLVPAAAQVPKLRWRLDLPDSTAAVTLNGTVSTP